MSQHPLVTIITPSFNQGQFIEATIESVLMQTYDNIEYIILDSLSNDGTAEVLDRYKDSGVTIIRERDKGQSDAIVKGFKLAKGELIGWINSDDILYPECVERIVGAYRDNPESVLFYNSKINIITETGSFSRLVDCPVIDCDHLLRASNTLVQPGSFYKNSALAAVDYFDDSLRFSMDLDLWLRLLKIGRCVNVGGPPIAGYREWDGTKTSTGDAKLLRERKAMLLRHGAAPRDHTIRAIDVALMKSAIKSMPVVGGVVKALEGIFKMTLLFSYYGFAAHLPASSTRYTRWCRTFRRAIVSRLLGQSGDNINVEKGAQFGTGAKISLGTNSGIGVNCKLMGKVTIGNNVMMGPEVVFITTTHDHARTDIPMFEQGATQEQPIHVGDDVWIGMRCTILPGVRIGNGVIVGAGSVVTKSVPDYVVVAGNPARVIRKRVTKSDELTHD